MPEASWFKCNTDGSSRGNPGVNTYAFCVRDERGELVFAEAQEIGISTNNMAEATSVLRGLSFCIKNKLRKVIIEKDSLGIMKVILREWKIIPWEMLDIMEEERQIVEQHSFKVQHVYRE
ncbi:hypothetical protein KY289_012313 [Solanum tuberosum]|nr:hypothetical protein KY289_012313 [Solanum tuberosum]